MSLLSKVFQKAYSPSATRQLSTRLSAIQAYPQVCLDASRDLSLFRSFRRNPIYNEILEHTSPEQGEEYLRLISEDPDVLKCMDRFVKNDDHGGPRLSRYPGIGLVSPSTLRYVKVLADLKKYFRSLDHLNVCEIGVGYGGQCRVVNAYYRPAAYTLVDIQPALALTQRFLDNYTLPSVLSYKTMNELARQSYDLVISNYAFTELPRSIQDVYLDRLLLPSKRGYITYNEITPTEFRSYRSEELARMIPGARILKEEPLTHPRNCLIVWGSAS